jgi:DNA polymerase-3 subunit epsilon
MFKKLQASWNKKGLKDRKYEFLFEPYDGDEIVVFDTETTGLNPKIDNIVSIGAIKIKGNKILTNDSFHILVIQDRAISSESIKIHQIRNCDITEGMPIKEAIDNFLDFIGNRKLAGYYLEFDIAMINRYLKPMYGIKLPNQQEEVSAIYYDKKIARIPQGNIDLRFDTIMNELSIPKLQGHDALNDATMTAMMYLKLKYSKQKLN